ncbi:Putative tyrosinase copper-binding domain, di-copper centre-containing domain superfamily [Colletotrichum destructivum]|uniref:tyrosinase n=1 Tax=Colletotrichum destructivum TaxID=34406 RepID=A0AAX4IR68_9PEZI|nr:Putative tyrosinase copper-binding domain, di-copper centre-containing domain superfamily [Colletotrichum destructivum]
MGGLIIRKNIRNLSTAELDNLVRAFAAIQKLPAEDPNSFFVIAGYHGEPFRGAGYANPAWWGGYCNHGNILFPTWHRAYLLRLEKALQSQVPGVALPYWDETEEATLTGGIPPVFLTKDYKFADGSSIPNPLFSYKFQARITDRLTPIPDANYTKPVGYETVRYPFSGLVGTPLNAEGSFIHNAALREQGEEATNQMLNDNIVTWLNYSCFRNSDGEEVSAGIKAKYDHCLDAPNYTVFSNGTSAQRWNDDHLSDKGYKPVVPLESPHNSMHLAVGGFEVPGQGNSNQIAGANGDMGENDTAAFDPIFYFHHCFVDLMFWRWQIKNNQRDRLEIIEGYPGTNSVDAQGPTPGVAGGTWLTLDSPLEPFKKPGDPKTAYTSNDVINIARLGYIYDNVGEPPKAAPPRSRPSPVLTVGNINRATIGGSFVVSAWATKENGDKMLIGTEAVLSRWHVAGCRNCQNYLEVRAHIPIEGWSKEEAEKMDFEVKLHTRTLKRGLGDGDDPQQGAQSPTVRLGTDHM